MLPELEAGKPWLQSRSDTDITKQTINIITCLHRSPSPRSSLMLLLSPNKQLTCLNRSPLQRSSCPRYRVRTSGMCLKLSNTAQIPRYDRKDLLVSKILIYQPIYHAKMICLSSCTAHMSITTAHASQSGQSYLRGRFIF